ncbi:hypothetical protein ABPG77_003074 [Micractinium sp. CCAP 211/92]
MARPDPPRHLVSRSLQPPATVGGSSSSSSSNSFPGLILPLLAISRAQLQGFNGSLVSLLLPAASQATAACRVATLLTLDIATAACFLRQLPFLHHLAAVSLPL